MKKNDIFRFSWLGFGSIGMLLTVITFFTISTLNKQEESLNQLVAERGIGFMDVYEKVIVSSVYTGISLDLTSLTENLVGSQSFIFTMVTDEDGTILLHSDQSLIGETIDFTSYLGRGFNAEEILLEPAWKSTHLDNQESIIVYKRFLKPRHILRLPSIRIQPLPTTLFPQIFTRLENSRNNTRDEERLQNRNRQNNYEMPTNERNRNTILDNFAALNSIMQNQADEIFNELGDYIEPIPSIDPIYIALSRKKELYLFVAQDMSMNNQSRLNSKMMIIFASIFIGLAAIILITVLQYISRNEAIQAKQAEKLLAIGDLTAGVAHEIRNPLSSIKGYATFFKQKFPENSSEQEAASIMADEVDRLNRAIDNLVGLSRSIDIKLENTNISELCTKICLLVESEAIQRNINLQFPSLEDNAIMAFIDPDKLKQALLNLLLNAMEGFDNTNIENKSIILTINKKGKQAHIIISDNGLGIKKEIQDRIFDPYFTTKSQGTGLGLVMVKNIVEAHNGNLELVSNEEAKGNISRGTTFTIHLPL